MAETKKKKTKKAVKKTRKSVSKRRRKAKWSDEQLAVRALIEEELHGLLQYLRAIHYLAILLIIASVAVLMFSLSVIFNDSQHAVVGFLVIIATSLSVAITAAWALRPWVLPRFLLPMDLSQLELKQLMTLFSDPAEYLQLLKTHTQVLTEQFLIPKLRRLRNAIILFIFGMSISILLAIALP